MKGVSKPARQWTALANWRRCSIMKKQADGGAQSRPDISFFTIEFVQLQQHPCACEESRYIEKRSIRLSLMMMKKSRTVQTPFPTSGIESMYVPYTRIEPHNCLYGFTRVHRTVSCPILQRDRRIYMTFEGSDHLKLLEWQMEAMDRALAPTALFATSLDEKNMENAFSKSLTEWYPTICDSRSWKGKGERTNPFERAMYGIGNVLNFRNRGEF